MDLGLDVRFLFSPFATAFAAGALFAFCVAHKKRRDSAPESTSRIPEPEFQENPGLKKFNSLGKNLDVITSNPRPIISTFPAFDGGRPASSTLGLSPNIANKSFTFSDDLINLERRFSKSFGTDTNSLKSHSCSLPNFRKFSSRSRLGGSIYPHFQPRPHSQFRDLYCSKSFQGERRAVSLEYPEVPVVYDFRETSRLIAKTVLKNNFKATDDCAQKSLPCFFRDKDLSRRPPRYFPKIPEVRHRFVEFPLTNVALIEYLCSNRECRFPAKRSNDQEFDVKYKNSVEYLSIKPGALEHSTNKTTCLNHSFDEKHTEENQVSSGISGTNTNSEYSETQLVDSEVFDSNKIHSLCINQTNILDSSYNSSNAVLESYVQVIKCGKHLAALSTIDFTDDLNFEGEIKFPCCDQKINDHTESKTENVFSLENSIKKTTDEERIPKFSTILSSQHFDNPCFSAKDAHTSQISEEILKIQNSKKEILNPTQILSIPNSSSTREEVIINTTQIPSETLKIPKNSKEAVISSPNSPTLQNSSSSPSKEPGKKRHPLQNAAETNNNLGTGQIGDKTPKKELLLSLTLHTTRTTTPRDVRARAADDPAVSNQRRQMDRRTRGRSVVDSSVSSETRVDGVVVSSVSVNGSDVWTEVVDTCRTNGVDMSVRTVISTDYQDNSKCLPDRGQPCGAEKPLDYRMPGGAVSPPTSTPHPYRPNFEEFMANVDSGLDANCAKELPQASPPRVTRLLGLLSRDEERRARAQLLLRQEDPSIEGEWDKILQDVLASVNELERFGDRQRDGKEVLAELGDRGQGAKDAEKKKEAEDDKEDHHSEMEEEVGASKGETPTKVKSLRFKLDPDIFDVPSDDSFYEDDEEDVRRGGWRRNQTKYRVEFGPDDPVQLVSVHASVVPAGQKMVARPVGIDLRVRLTEDRGKRAHTSPLQQAKRRSPVSDSRWCQELSPVTENVDWRETFTGVKPNGILKTPSPKAEAVVKDTTNPFKEELTNGNGVHADKPTNGVDKVPVKTNGMTLWNPPQKKFSLPRKKFEPDPDAVDRITGYKVALSKPPLPPPPSCFAKMASPSMRNRAEIARKQYLDNKAALSAAASKADGSSRKFQQFLAQAQNDRARLVTSVPDLAAIEKAVNEKWSREKGSPRASPAREEENGQKLVETPSSRGSTPDDAWSSYVQTCRKHLGRRSQSMTYLETDVDLVPCVEDEDKWRSTSALDQPEDLPVQDTTSSDLEQDDSGRARSEHELRIQRSLQSMPLPDWYKRSDKPKTGFLLKSSEKEKRGWAAAKSLASSTSSLASCGIKRPVHSLRSSRENIPWSRGSASPDGPALSLALAKAFREPYLGWRARTSTTSSGVSSSPPSSWCANTTTDEEANGISFDGEDAFGRTSSEDPPSPADDTGADAVTVSMDTGELAKLPGGEDTCDDINNMSMDTCEIFDTGFVQEDPSIIVPGESSPLADTGDDIDNLSTDTATEDKRKTLSTDRNTDNSTDTAEDRRNTSSEDNSKLKKDPKSKRYSYSQSIYNSEWDEEENESRGDRKSSGRTNGVVSPTSSDSKVIWIESSFVGSRTTTSIVVLPEGRESKVEGDCIERPASR